MIRMIITIIIIIIIKVIEIYKAEKNIIMLFVEFEMLA